MSSNPGTFFANLESEKNKKDWQEGQEDLQILLDLLII